MSKWYEVKVTKIEFYAVEVEDNETESDAQTLVSDNCFDWDDIESSLQPESQLDNLLNNTDKDKIYSL